MFDEIKDGRERVICCARALLVGNNGECLQNLIHFFADLLLIFYLTGSNGREYE